MAAPHYDAVIIGAGAAGLFCAAQAGQRGLRVLLLDHAERLAEKIRISGGGRCNFTNREASPAQYLSDNPQFCRSALARYPAADFIALVRRHGVAFHEKHKGQLFCDRSAQDLIDLLLRECEVGGVTRWQPCRAGDLRREQDGRWSLRAECPGAEPQRVQADAVVVATGGLPVPKIGASDFGLRLAERLGHRLVEPRPALVPLSFDPAQWAPFVPLAGIALPVRISTEVPARRGVQRVAFDEDLLFTHHGLSGPAVLQISSFWRPGQWLEVDLLPSVDLAAELARAKAGSRRQLGNVLTSWLPARLTDTWLALHGPDASRPVAELPDAALRQLAVGLQGWRLQPTGTEGWRKAEVMAGGVDTRDLSSQTLESRHQPGLYFIGEVVDVTGWLGGYNFQWAWSSAYACAEAMAERHANANANAGATGGLVSG